MKTIEERAKRICTSAFCYRCPKQIYTTCIWLHNTEIAEPQCRIGEWKDLIVDTYQQAVIDLKEQREELTCWHDPKDEMPEGDEWVLVRLRNSKTQVAYYDIDAEMWLYPLNNYMVRPIIIGWRKIHE